MAPTYPFCGGTPSHHPVSGQFSSLSSTRSLRFERRRLLPRRVLVALLLATLWLAAAPALGIVLLKLEMPEGPSEPAAIVLIANDGSRQQITDGASLGEFILSEGSGAGTYELILTSGSVTVSKSVELPASGEVAVFFDPATEPPDFQVQVQEWQTFEGEVVVTARKREEAIDQVPIAITAFTDEAMTARSMRDLSDIADFTPNLDFSVSGGAGGAPSEATVYLRGVGQIETGIFADPGVGIYVDGVYIARSQGAVLDLLDLERVEVLRGPQGTLFGKNTTGGAIQLIPRRPSSDREGRLMATVGDLDRHDLQLRVAGALGENVFGSLALASRNRDGYLRSLQNGQETGDENRDSGRLALRWLANDRTVVDFSLDHQRENETALDQGLIATFPADLLEFYNRVLVGSGLTPLTDAFITDDLSTSFSDFPSRSEGDVSLATLRIHHTTPKFDLLSITALRDVEYSGSSDFDGTPIGLFARTYVQTQDQWSQELQFSGTAKEGRLDWLVGALYFEENPVDDALTFSTTEIFPLLEAAPGRIYAPPGAPAFLCDPVPLIDFCFGGAGNPLNFGFFIGDGLLDLTDIETTSWAVFGEGTWALGDRTSLTVGLRFTEETKDFRFFTDPRNQPARTLQDSDRWEEISPRLSLSHQATDEVMVYASASKGFKSGGFNAGRSQSRSSLNPYDQETLWAYEAGLKAELFDRKLRLSSALFAYDYDDIQFASFLVVDNEIFLVIQNAADGKIEGFELELEALPGAGLRLLAGLGWTETEYTDLRAQGGAPQNGVIPKTPEWTLDLGLEKRWQLAQGGQLVGRADLSYRSEYFNDVANSPEALQEEFELLNLRLAYAPPSERWEVALFATNVGDTEYREHSFVSPPAGVATAIGGRPREWGLSFDWRF